MAVVLILLKTGTGLVGRIAIFVVCAPGVFLLVYVVSRLCLWLDVTLTYAIYLLPFWAMFSNDLQRIKNAERMQGTPGVAFEARGQVVGMERAYLWADLLGFVSAVVFLSPLDLW